MNSQETARILAALHGAYPHVEIDDPIAAIWASALGADDYSITMQAVTEWVGSERYWPTIAEMRTIVRRLQGRVNEERAITAGRNNPPDVADIQKAKAAFSEGYRRSRRQAGDTEEVIGAKLATYMRKFPGSVLAGAGNRQGHDGSET